MIIGSCYLNFGICNWVFFFHFLVQISFAQMPLLIDSAEDPIIQLRYNKHNATGQFAAKGFDEMPETSVMSQTGKKLTMTKRAYSHGPKFLVGLFSRVT